MNRAEMPQRKLKARFSASAASIILLSSPALAQTAAEEQLPTPTLPATVEGPKTYMPQDFARFAPKNALDMLRQVPGFIIQGASQERGLGQASGNVLINGQRISGKSNDAVTELSRIPAGSVVRIEIVDGATLNIAGLSGQIANVIAKASGMKGQFNWRPEFRAENTKPLLTAGSASVSGASGPLSYTVGVRNDSFRGGSSGPTSIYNDAGDLTDFRDDLLLSSGEVPKISGSLKYDGPGGSIGNLNASYALFNFTFRELSERSGPALVDRIRRIRTTEREYNYEVGGDYEMGVGPGRLKLIGLRNFEHSPIVTTSVTSFADDAPQTGSRFARNADETETVGRAEYRWKSGPADWQVSAEGAFNVLDNVSGFFVLQPNGEFSEVPLPNGSATVKEDRAEASVTYGRPLSAKLAVQASLGAEYSQLSQTGEAGKTRTFYRPKGFVSAAWKATPRLDVNARLERKVGQLNFYDFLASENLSSGTSNAGNADLVPPQSWDAELSGVRNLGAWGTTTVRAYARLISDIVDQIPIGLTGEAPGNLDEAKLYGVEWKSTVNFTPIGWSGAKLDARFQLQNSKLNDPLTGEPRRISGNMMHLANLSLRHDVPGSDWAWGTSLSYQRNARIFRLNEIYRQYEGPAFGNLFLENKDVLGLTLRGTIGNLYGGDDIMHRVAHVGRRNATGIAFVERRKRTIGPIFAFSVSGTI